MQAELILGRYQVHDNRQKSDHWSPSIGVEYGESEIIGDFNKSTDG